MILDFPNGILLLPRDIPAPVTETAAWASYPMVIAMVGVFVVAAIINLRSFFQVLPPIADCMFRSKANVSLEHSINLAIVRNRTAMILMIPLALLFDRFGIYRPRFIQDLGPEWTASLIFGVMLAARGLHFLPTRLLSRQPKLDNDHTLAASHAYLNFWTISTILMLATAIILALCRVPDEAIRTVLYIEMGVVFVFQCGNIFEILRVGCNAFVSFLYLCALEILPVGLLVASAVIL